MSKPHRGLVGRRDCRVRASAQRGIRIFAEVVFLIGLAAYTAPAGSLRTAHIEGGDESDLTQRRQTRMLRRVVKGIGRFSREIVIGVAVGVIVAKLTVG
jgi:hypothetical protein